MSHSTEKSLYDTQSGAAFDAAFNAKGDNADELFHVTGMAPTRKNVERARKIAKREKKFAKIVTFLDGVLKGRYRSEWRYQFGGEALGDRLVGGSRKVSAASGAFSQIRQALHYGE